MNHRRFAVAFAAILWIVTAAAQPVAAPPQPAAPAASNTAGQASEALTRADLTSLLRAGIGDAVIARQIRLSGLGFRPAPADLISLKRAGASDALLEVLLAEAGGEASVAVDPSRPPETPRVTALLEARELPEVRELAEALDVPLGVPTRVFETTDRAGRRVLVITNLDDTGHRLGEIDGPADGRADGAPIVPRVVASKEGLKIPNPPADATASATNKELLRQALAEMVGDGPLVQVINNPPAPSEPAPAPPPAPAAAPAYAGYPCGIGGCGGFLGAATGGLKYPDHLWFLGYKPDPPPRTP